jgi:cystathionine beta-lyase/cystathionine gamma-synthase
LTYRYAAYDTIGSFVSGTNPIVIPGISPSQSQSILIAAGMRATNNVTLTTPSGMTAVVVDNDSNGPSYIICDQVATKGPTGTRATDAGSNNSVAGIMLAIKPTRSLT